MSVRPRTLKWAIVGVGRAGRARARAIDRDARSRLVAVHRGRNAAETGAPEVSFEEALDVADAVAICTPDALHVDMVEATLRAGKHAVVEYPMAPSATEAESGSANTAPGCPSNT